MQEWREVSKEEFLGSVGQLDVHPTTVGQWPYTSEWKTRAGRVIGKTVDYLPEGSGLPKTRYYVLLTNN